VPAGLTPGQRNDEQTPLASPQPPGNKRLADYPTDGRRLASVHANSTLSRRANIDATSACAGTLDRALSQWEWVAALVPGDPQFLPRPTILRPEQLITIDRGPRLPIVWLDPATSRPVLSPYGRETDLIAGILAGQPRVPKQALLCPTSDGGPPLARPIVIVRLLDDQTRKVIGDALAAAAERDNKTAGEIAEDKVNYAFWSRNAQERAIMGDY